MKGIIVNNSMNICMVNCFLYSIKSCLNSLIELMDIDK